MIYIQISIKNPRIIIISHPKNNNFINNNINLRNINYTKNKFKTAITNNKNIKKGINYINNNIIINRKKINNSNRKNLTNKNNNNSKKQINNNNRNKKNNNNNNKIYHKKNNI